VTDSEADTVTGSPRALCSEFSNSLDCWVSKLTCLSEASDIWFLSQERLAALFLAVGSNHQCTFPSPTPFNFSGCPNSKSLPLHEPLMAVPSHTLWPGVSRCPELRLLFGLKTCPAPNHHHQVP
jgi:hypothetical protein